MNLTSKQTPLLTPSLALSLVLALGSLGSCAAVADKTEKKPATWRNPHFTAAVFFDDRELGEIDFDDDLETILGEGIKDVERQRAGARVTIGSSNLSAYAQIFGEEIDSFDSTQLDPGSAVTIDDLFGFGLGVIGVPTLKRVSDGVRVVAPYRAGFNVVIGEGNFTDATGPTLLKSPTEEGDLAYLETEFSVGVGVNAHGFQPSFGLFLTSLAGIVDDEIVADSDDDDLRFEGTNAGLFLEFAYIGTDVPLTAGVRGTVGDVQGLEAFFGVSL